MRRRELMALVAGAMVASRRIHAQQKTMPVIGFLGVASAGPFARAVAAYREGLRQAGWVEGQNVAIEYRWADSRRDRLDDLAAELVARKVDAITTSGGASAALAAKRATATIPILFETGADPVETGLVASFAHPGANLTGVTIVTAELNPKRLELLLEMVPSARTIGLLWDPNNPNTPRLVREVQEAAHAKGVELHVVTARGADEFEPAFAALAGRKANALMVGNSSVFFGRREQLAALAARHGIPAVYASRGFAEAGGLISYGTNIAAMYRVLGGLAGRILAGAKPADLPVQQPTIFELVVNLKTAKALSLTVTQAILARADEVIE